MIPILAASCIGNPNTIASTSVPKIPNCPAAPINANTGCASSGRKSIIAPTPMKINSGSNSLSTVACFNTANIPCSAGSVIAENGRFPMMHPIPIGSSSTGSYSRAIAK